MEEKRKIDGKKNLYSLGDIDDIDCDWFKIEISDLIEQQFCFGQGSSGIYILTFFSFSIAFQ